MIISQYFQYVFVSVPKTGTQTMFATLVDHYHGERSGGFHERRIPGVAKLWYTFSIVRNPFERAVSLWYSTTQRNPKDDHYGFRAACPDVDNPASFINWIATNPPCVRPWAPLTWTQYEQLYGIALDTVLHTENLNHEFNQLPFVATPRDIGRRNVATRKLPTHAYMSQDLERAIVNWAGDDFQRYNYPTIFIHPTI